MQTIRRTNASKISSTKITCASLFGALCLFAIGAARAAPLGKTAEARLTEAWRTAISGTDVPGQGCFTAEYPSTTWTRVGCIKAPPRLYLPAHGPRGFVVGNGNDFAAVTSTPISYAIGSFPAIYGLTNEINGGASDT